MRTTDLQADLPEVMAPGDVARYFGVDPTTVTRWAKEGKLPFVQTLGGHRRFERDKVVAARNGDGLPEDIVRCVNAAVDLLTGELDLGERDTDLLNLAVNATVTLSREPDASFDDVIETSYNESPEQVRGWWDW